MEGSPNFFLHLSSSLLFEKRLCGRFPIILYICLPVFSYGRFPQPQLTRVLFEKGYVEGSPINYLPLFSVLLSLKFKGLVAGLCFLMAGAYTS